ncbi:MULTISPECIES: H-NS family nucleoid-associated regulatory protein [Xanthomonas]|uniref:H-NS family nucleoid-associated regulatory protein n=1 Tax=Xanthomonas TaxID=338 RepID=UPI001E2EF7FF|nr:MULTISPECIES: H-NS family nucleoid-associated regulatory protein [Xanthomonas]
MAKLIGETIDAKPLRAPKDAARSRKCRKLGKVAPKYLLPSGETWAGRGLAPKAFKAWAKSAEGKAWAKVYPGEVPVSRWQSEEGTRHGGQEGKRAGE